MGMLYQILFHNFTLEFKKKIKRLFLMGICCMTQGTQTGALDNKEGWDGKKGGREVQEGWDICTPITDSC